MGIGGLREHSLSWNDKVNAGAKPPVARQPACEHRRVLPAGRSVVIMSSLISSHINFLFVNAICLFCLFYFLVSLPKYPEKIV